MKELMAELKRLIVEYEEETGVTIDDISIDWAEDIEGHRYFCSISPRCRVR